MEKKIGLLFSLAFFVGCSTTKIIDITRDIAPLETTEHIVHDLNTADLDTHSFKFRWHLGDADDEAVPGSTLDMPSKPHVCADVDDINKRNAWVRASVPPTLDELLKQMSVSKKKRKIFLQHATPMIMEYITKEKSVEKILDSYEPGRR